MHQFTQETNLVIPVIQILFYEIKLEVQMQLTF